MNVLPSQKYAKQGHIILGVHEDEDKIYLLDRYLLADMTTGYAILTYDKKRKEANEFEAPIEDERLQAWGSNKRISESEAKTKFAEKIMSLQKSPPLSPGEPAQGKQAEVTVTKLAEGVMVRRIEAPGEEPFRVNLMKQTNTLRSGKTYSVEYAEVVETEGFEGFEIRKKGDTIALHKLHFL